MFDMDSLNTAIRLDFGDGGTKFQIRDVYYEYRGKEPILIPRIRGRFLIGES